MELNGAFTPQMVAILTSNNKSAPSVSVSSQTLSFCGDRRVKYNKLFKGRFNVGFLRHCYTVKCFVQLVSHCLCDIVAGQVARNVSQCNIPCIGQHSCETICKSRCQT